MMCYLVLWPAQFNQEERKVGDMVTRLEGKLEMLGMKQVELGRCSAFHDICFYWILNIVSNFYFCGGILPLTKA